MAKERMLYPPRVISFNEPGFPQGKEIDYEIYHDAMKRNKVGDTIRSYVAAPGTGFIEHLITKMDNTGVYGIVTRNTVRELTVAEVI